MSLVRAVVGPVFATDALATFVPADYAYDIAIGGLPFLLANTPDTPMIRETAQFRKEQVDQTEQPGEHSLNDWWLRSQLSFHAGAGRVVEDPATGTDADNAIRFSDSVGLDVWTPGQVSLLKSTTQRVSTAATSGAVLGAGGSVYCYVATGSALQVHSTTGAGSAVTWGGAGTIDSRGMIGDGVSYYMADTTGIYKGAIPSGAGALLWNTGSRTCLGWCKQRLMAGIGNKIYELSGAGPVLPAALYTHPATSWSTTSFTEGPSAIYASGFVGNESVIVRFGLETSESTTTPTLQPGIEVARLPLGELVTSIRCYLNTFFIIGSDRGVRVGFVDASSGAITYGPLIALPDGGVAVRGMFGDDRFVYVAWSNAINGQSGLLRIDLSREVDAPAFPTGRPGRYAYATDLQTKVTGQVLACGRMDSGRKAMVVIGQGSYVEDASTLEPSGTLTTGKVRFSTLEPKLFKFLTLRAASPIVGSLAASVLDADGSVIPLASYSSSTALEQVAIPLAPCEQVQIRVTLNSNGTTGGPTWRGYQLKALPAGKRQRVLTFPVLVYDHMKDRNGVAFGLEGSAAGIQDALEALEERGVEVLLQEFRAGLAPRSRTCVLEHVRFQQQSPPLGFAGFGGLAVVTLRSLA